MFDHANIGFCRAGKDSDRVAIINMLQHSDGDILEHTSEDWNISLLDALSNPWMDPESVRSEQRSTYLERLKQLGIRFSNDSDWGPPVFRWIVRIIRREVTIEPWNVEFTLQTMLGFGADIDARKFGYSPLHCVFLKELDFSDDTRLNVQCHNLMETAKALLKHGADPFALTDYGHSVLDIAEEDGWTTELHEVLQQTGYDLDEVRYKIDLAQWIFNNPDRESAESTAIDSSQIEPPSTAGLN